MVEVLRLHLYVTGRVQGVWFREATRQRASELGVEGWVRNLPDGRVEASFEGPPGAVRSAVDFVREGPPHASVTGVDIVEEAMISIEPRKPVSFQVR